MQFDALLLLSFGGPEGPEQVMPFLENVTRGRGIPRERLESVAEHYLHFGGVSPINGINRALIDEIRATAKLSAAPVLALTSPEAYSMRMTSTSTVRGKPEKMDMQTSGRWLGGDCGAIKPLAMPKQ